VLLGFAIFISGFPYVLAIELPQVQRVSVSGTLGEEVFTPACRNYVPPCMAPSFIVPILLAKNNTVYTLTSDNLTLKEQLPTENGSFVTVTGFLQPFNASMYDATFICSPYRCGAIVAQISVISLEQGTNSTTIDQTSATVDQTSMPTTQPVPGFEIPSILLGLALGVVVIATRRRTGK